MSATAYFYLELGAIVMLVLAVLGAVLEKNEAAGRIADRLGRWVFDR